MSDDTIVEPGVDRHGNPVVDPTRNVLDLVEAAIKRQDDLRKAELDGLAQRFAEKFDSIDRQLGLIEQQRVEQKADTKAAVDAALTAQKEAVREQTSASERAIAKSEAATSKQIEQLNTTFTTANDGVVGNLADVKERVGKMESIRAGVNERTTDQRQNLGAVLGVVLGVVGVLSLVVSVVIAVSA